ncbi:CocE/NonD family hydrolase [Bryobacter aggregatus]|uniref:CocE/NonD family hydrolase n=1 Tax=Bryobacter aggregatus TaxID=360054 RepID=UPI000690C0EC|nr:CocE/NonD family hydrolase [Bryobacter aggregatus]
MPSFFPRALLLLACSVLLCGQVQRVQIPMRDGVQLVADVYGASAGERKPVLLQRTPYNRKGAAATAQRYAAAGYVVVVQDTRGRSDSEGVFFPYNNEGQDGFDTTDWILRQSWANGRIGMWGASYVGAVQYQAAAEDAPGLAVLAPTATWTSFYNNIYTGGVSRLALIATAAAGLYPPPAGVSAPVDWYKTLHALPLADLDLAIGWRIPWLQGILAHPRPDGFWTRLNLIEKTKKLSIPAQHVVGYYDFFNRETVANFQRLSQTEAPQQLILGPWDHGTIGKRKLGEVDFGAAAELNLMDENLRWFNRFLKESAPTSFPAVRYFSMGDNRWHTAAKWPPETAQTTAFYLHSGGKANTRNGDGRLDRKAPQTNEAADTFHSDPVHPVPAWPPAIVQAKFTGFWGPVDQGPNEDLKDVLVYDSGRLTAPLRIAGPVEAELWVSQDTPDADWVVKLIDVWPNGFAQNLAVGVQRISMLPKAPPKPGLPNLVRVDVGHVAAQLEPGHSLRVEITGAYFPLFDRNTNTGKGPYDATMRVAEQKLFHSRNRASKLSLFVLPAQ